MKTTIKKVSKGEREQSQSQFPYAGTISRSKYSFPLFDFIPCLYIHNKCIC